MLAVFVLGLAFAGLSQGSDQACSDKGDCDEAECCPNQLGEFYGCCGNQGCNPDTGGTCSHLTCDDSRGPTDCKSGRCHCKHGYCARAGVCVSNDQIWQRSDGAGCSNVTGGSCSFLACNAEREAVCEGGLFNKKCLCPIGSCAGVDGNCHKACSKETNTNCPGQVCHGANTVCVMNTDTGDFKCVCADGFCADDSAGAYERACEKSNPAPDPPAGAMHLGNTLQDFQFTYARSIAFALPFAVMVAASIALRLWSRWSSTRRSTLLETGLLSAEQTAEVAH